MPLDVTVWGEYHFEHENEIAGETYPDGVHAAIADFLDEDFEVHTATLADPEHGLTEEVVAETDVLVWFSHLKNDAVDDAVVDRVCRRVLEGMGLIVLHSGCRSKVFRQLMGTSCDRGVRDLVETQRVWVVDPGHPIVDGLQRPYIELPEAQANTEPFDIPEPDRLVMVSWFEGGDVFRSGCCFRRGNGRIFMFGPGHEEYPIYRRDDVQLVIGNAVEWAAPTDAPHQPAIDDADVRHPDPLEPVEEHPVD